VPPKMVARMIMIPWLGSLAFYVVLVRAHIVSIHRRSAAAGYRHVAPFG
jgi:hypothetical protein